MTTGKNFAVKRLQKSGSSSTRCEQASFLSILQSGRRLADFVITLPCAGTVEAASKKKDKPKSIKDSFDRRPRRSAGGSPADVSCKISVWIDVAPAGEPPALP